MKENKKKTLFVDSLEVGRKYEGLIAGVKNVKAGKDMTSFTLFDQKGEMVAEMPAGKGELTENGIYRFTVTILYKGAKKAVVKEVSKAEPGTYSPLDINKGISPETVKAYKSAVESAIGKVKKEELKKGENTPYTDILLKYFTKEEFTTLCTRPATVGEHGLYLGGALAQVVNLSTLSYKAAAALCSYQNGLYEVTVDMALLLTCSLLSCAGIGEYIGTDLKKTQRGVSRERYSLMQEHLEKVFLECNTPEEVRDVVLNTLHCMYPGAGAIMSVTLESSIVRSVYALYSEMDKVAFYLATEVASEEELEQGYRFADSLNRPFVLFKGEEEKQEEGVKNVS